MTRKSQQAGGHNPLTYHERKRLKSSGYGTQSTRLTTASQLPFGHCCLNLSPIIEEGGGGSATTTATAAVATPSGHIYSREAIVQYLLTKNGELKKQKAEYERRRLVVENRRVEWEEKERKSRQETFMRKDQGAMSSSSSSSSPLPPFPFPESHTSPPSFAVVVASFRFLMLSASANAAATIARAAVPVPVVVVTEEGGTDVFSLLDDVDITLTSPL
mmetsp:Transcript_4532/g.8789  ORF Transcript_4532/g.8789 Transcript_4532/m.8789 type:complete len:217 (-) Transcript_4532:1187-1837(-)